MINKITTTNQFGLFEVQADYIAHQVNCRGVMGAGIAKTIREHNEQVYTRYKQFCSTYQPSDLLGKSFICDNIISIFGQLNYGRDVNTVYTDYEALCTAFQSLHNRLPLDKSIAFPYRMGCGLGNGKWDIVLALIKHCFRGRTIYIVEYKEAK